MDNALQDLASPRERIIRGAHGWWFLGPGGIARLDERHMTEQAQLRDAARDRLREQGLFTAPPFQTYALTVLTSTDCNLGCGYCFQNQGQDPTGGSRPPRIAHTRLKSDTITRLLEFSARRMAEAGIERLRVMLFGGEPLLNPRGCVELLARAADYGLDSASMTSNGTLLTPLLGRQLAGLGLRCVQVTFDGTREAHDHIRVTRSGGPTFDAIVDNIARVSDVAPITWFLRINMSQHNKDDADELIGQLAAKLDPARCVLDLNLVGDAGIGYGVDLDLDGTLAAFFHRIHRQALDAGFQVKRPRSYTPCPACSYRDGRYGAVVGADGYLSSCWESAGKPDWRVGSVDDGYDADSDRRWTTCEADWYPDDRRQLNAFNDIVDAALLDYMWETGRRI